MAEWWESADEPSPVSPQAPRPPERAWTVSDGHPQAPCGIRFRGDPAGREVRIDLDGELELAQHFMRDRREAIRGQQREASIASGWRTTPTIVQGSDHDQC